MTDIASMPLSSLLRDIERALTGLSGSLQIAETRKIEWELAQVSVSAHQRVAALPLVQAFDDRIRGLFPEAREVLLTLDLCDADGCAVTLEVDGLEIEATGQGDPYSALDRFDREMALANAAAGDRPGLYHVETSTLVKLRATSPRQAVLAACAIAALVRETSQASEFVELRQIRQVIHPSEIEPPWAI